MSELRNDQAPNERPLHVWVCGIIALLGVALALVLILRNQVDVKPDRTGGSVCEAQRKDDDLVHLAQRATSVAARAQLTRWLACDLSRNSVGRTTSERADSTLWPADALLILFLAVAMVASALLMARQVRWRAAAAVGGALAVLYVVADGGEDILLHRLLTDGRWDPWLPIASYLKFGTILAATPLFVAAVFVLLAGEPKGDLFRNRPCPDDPGTQFFTRWLGRIKPPKTDVPAAAKSDVPTEAKVVSTKPKPGDMPPPALGVCCSGGGIRSAAFSLGILQELDAPPKGNSGDPSSELGRAESLYAVSGGSYMAAAWVTARTRHPNRTPPTWSRLSAEEQHLRRHASYLAPGIGGKVWALVWFLLAFIANAALVVLILGATFLPVGWALHLGMQSRPVERGELTLPGPACIQLADGSFLTAVPGTKLRLGPGSDVAAADGVAVDPPKEVTPTSAGAPRTSAATVVSGATPAAVPEPEPASALVSNTCTDSPHRAGDGVRTDAPGRSFIAGTGVPIRPGPAVAVRGTQVVGCRSLVMPVHSTCAARDAAAYKVTSGSRLRGAPGALLTLDGPAIVAPGTHRLEQACGDAVCERFRLNTVLSWLPRIALGLFGMLGLALVTMRQVPKTRRRVQGWTRKAAVVAGLLAFSLWWLPQLVVVLNQGRSWVAHRTGAVSGASAGTLTVIVALLSQLRSASGKSTTATGPVANFIKSAGARLRPVLVRFAAVIVGPALLLGVALTFAALGSPLERDHSQIALGVVLVGWLLIFGTCGDLNRLSLHAYYRDHLRSAFAVEPGETEPRDDDLTDLPGGRHPAKLVLSATANLADIGITAPGRPAVPWLFSKTRVGSVGTGFYAPENLPARFSELGSVWTSVAVSGAAFSPAMGKMTRPERFLFALGNLRLGVWYPNPRYSPNPIDAPSVATQGVPTDFGPAWYAAHHPRPWYLFKEGLGLHKLRDPWVYVTDGGHYENLGLVELLAEERCLEVYCFDAAGDSTSTFGTLADAMRLAREEHGIEIVLDPRALQSDKDGYSRFGVWAGTVKYPPCEEHPARTGWIVFAKLTVPEGAPFDIIDLARTLKSFPTNPTADQLYTDQKFEAYRALGAHLGEEAVVAGRTLRKLIKGGVPPAAAVERVNQAFCDRPVPTCPPPPGAAPPTTKDATEGSTATKA